MMKKGIILSAIVILLICCNGYSQTNEETYQGFQFDFLPPGARSMAMGGAFIGLADDSTAVYSNPAGLVVLTRPEISAAYRQGFYTTLRASNPDVFSTGDLTKFDAENDELNFISFILPLRDISLGIFYSNYLDYCESYFYYNTRQIPGSISVLNPVQGKLELFGCYWSLSAAAKITDFLNIGASVNVTSLEIKNYIRAKGINFSDYYDLSRPQIYELFTDSVSYEIGYTVGIMLIPSSNFSIGAVYNYNPKFDYAQEVWEPSRKDGIKRDEDTLNLTINLPDRIGLGIAYRPLDELVIVGDVIYILYEQLTEKMISTYNYDSGTSRGDDITGIFQAPNSTELHFGAEYAFLGSKNPFFIRAGAFLKQDHRIRFMGDESFSRLERYRWNFDTYSNEVKDTDIGFSIGAGIRFSGIQIDGALSMSSLYWQATIAMVFIL